MLEARLSGKTLAENPLAQRFGGLSADSASNKMANRRLHLAVCLLALGALSSAYAWNYTEDTRLGYISQGDTKTQTGIVLNWRSDDSSSSLQSFYVSMPANSLLDVEVSCDAQDAMLYTEVVPNTIGFYRGLSLPSGWNLLGTVKSGSSSRDVQIHMHYEKTPWVRGTFVTYASLKLTCRRDNNVVPTPATEYTVVFDPNGGSGGATWTIASGGTLGTLPSAFRSGFKLRGWYDAQRGGTKVKPGAKVTKNAKYYASWKANTYKIKFDPNGGKGKMSKKVATYGKIVTLRANAFKRSGYAFKGWAKKKKGSVAYKNKAKVKNLTTVDGKTVTLYAVWKRKK